MRLLSSSSSKSSGFGGALSEGSTPLQRMHDLLKGISDIDNAVNDPEKCASLLNCIDTMNEVSMEDVGLKKDDLKSKMSYSMSVIACDSHDIAVFVVPAGNALPLHDHPGMMVASKILHGSLEVTTFNEAHNGLYSSSTDVKSADDGAWFLTPTDGNLHQFRAINTCVILDVLTPPYNEERKCTFYQLKRAEGLYWKLNARPSYWMPNGAEIVYNGNSYYRGDVVTK